MITLESGTEYVYAQEIRSSSDYLHREGNLEERAERENSYLLVEGKNGKEALVLQEIQPKIKGVVVVCQGGKNSDVRQSVTQAVTVALNITSSRVYVTALS
jgi:stage III sporulation protein AG